MKSNGNKSGELSQNKWLYSFVSSWSFCLLESSKCCSFESKLQRMSEFWRRERPGILFSKSCEFVNSVYHIHYYNFKGQVKLYQHIEQHYFYPCLRKTLAC